MNLATTPARAFAIRFALSCVAALIGGIAGMYAGAALGHFVARVVGRDPAELKDMLVMGLLFGILLGGAAGVWLALVLTRAHIAARRVALVVLALTALCQAGMMYSAYPAPKTSGHPLVDYELRLPADLKLPENVIRVTTWQGKNGHGAAIKRVETVDGRIEIAGNFLLSRDHMDQTMSFGMPSEQGPPIRRESYWRIPIATDAKLETNFRHWQKIEFLPHHESVVPVPAGSYDIRYRVRAYR